MNFAREDFSVAGRDLFLFFLVEEPDALFPSFRSASILSMLTLRYHFDNVKQATKIITILTLHKDILQHTKTKIMETTEYILQQTLKNFSQTLTKQFLETE